MKKLIILASILVIAVAAGAYNGWQSKVPNGSVNSCNTCHLNGDFKDDLANNNNTWDATLAAMDSDSDGYTNGQELRDPNGTWSEGNPDPGDPADVTNPDDPNDWNAIFNSSFGEIKANFK
jgi:hypothetical protein